VLHDTRSKLLAKS